ncbi:hypothetical protein LMH73_017725 [Vibrio splendidus]|nr:hypothetical protein [Vibrio splendidus]MCC4880371.1 hypothetical protein [Vibrio splendidus]
MNKVNLRKGEQSEFATQGEVSNESPFDLPEINKDSLKEEDLFEDASPEMLAESNKRDEALVNASKWTFLRYLKEIHTSPKATLRDETLPAMRYAVGHMLLSSVACFLIAMFTALTGDTEMGGVVSFITGISYLSVSSTILVFSILLFNNFLIGSFVYIFGKSLTIFNVKGDYKRFVRNLFPTTAVFATLQFLAMPLLTSVMGNKDIIILNAIIATTPALLSYCSVKTVGKKGIAVYVVLAAWIGLFYFIFADKLGY